MIEITGDFFKEAKANTSLSYDAIVCTTNLVTNSRRELIMGAGIARAFKLEFPWLPAVWGEQILERESLEKKKDLMVYPTTVPGPFGPYVLQLVAFPTKYHWKENSSQSLITRSTFQLELMAHIMGWKKVLMTRPGCGCGGLVWDKVKNWMGVLDDRFVVIERDG